MSNIWITIFLIIFTIVPVYYLTVVYSIYYKKILKNKNNLKFSFKTTSITTYLPSIIFAIINLYLAF